MTWLSSYKGAISRVWPLFVLQTGQHLHLGERFSVGIRSALNWTISPACA